MKINIDKKKCIGCGACVSLCPDMFKMKDGKAEVISNSPKSNCMKDASDGCPSYAISIK